MIGAHASNPPAQEALRLEGVTRTYGAPPVQALAGVDLRIEQGELLAIVGPSGSGKSTLLNVMGTLDLPSAGRVFIDGIDVRGLSDAQLSALRCYRIGFVFQQFHLTEGISALDNVAGGLLYAGVGRRERQERARRALVRVGLEHRLDHRPNQLPGGERQRVAIARAVVGDPGDPPRRRADGPTGNLDSRSGESIVRLLYDLNTSGTTVVVNTHDPGLAARMPRQVTIRDGLLIGDERRTEDAA